MSATTTAGGSVDRVRGLGVGAEAASLVRIGALPTILLGATALRLFKLSEFPLEQDELYTLRGAQEIFQHVNARPAYFLVQRLVLEVVPASPLSLRMAAFVFGILGVWATWFLAREIFGRTAAAVAAVLVAVSPWHLYVSQFGRYWTLVYLLAALAYVVLPRAIDRDRPADLLLALLVVVVGTLSHPTFLFPLAGASLALLLTSRVGVGPAWPTRNAWRMLWGPLLCSMLMAYAALVLTGNEGALRNWDGRGMTATLRLLPAIIQWMGPAIAVAAVVGVVCLMRSKAGTDRRWALMAALGGFGALGLLVTASLYTDVYSDYATAILPLVYVTIGGGLQRVSERLLEWRPVSAWAATAVLVAGALPGTVSHMVDGTRFDYRPSFSHIQQHGPDHLVLGWPDVMHRYYAPELEFEELNGRVEQMERALRKTNGFWVLSSFHRQGPVMNSRGTLSWIDSNCRRSLVTEGARLDYRTYRVELHWCAD